MNLYFKLLQSGQFAEVLRLSLDKTDSDSIYARCQALEGLNQQSEALNYLIKYHDYLYDCDPIKFMRTHIDLLLDLRQIKDAYMWASKYQSMAYYSMEVEEFVHDLPNYIEQREKQNRPLLDDENLTENLQIDQTSEKQLFALNYISKMNINEHNNEIISLCSLGKDYNVRLYAFLILMSKKHNQNLAFTTKKSKTVILNPSLVTPPFASLASQQLKKAMETFNHDTSINQIALKIYEQVTLNLFPTTLDAYSMNNLLVALSYLASKALGNIILDIAAFANHIQVDNDKIKEIIHLIEENQ